MPPQLREIGFHVQNHATQWHGFQHEIQFQEVVVAWIQLTRSFMQLHFWTLEPGDMLIMVTGGLQVSSLTFCSMNGT